MTAPASPARTLGDPAAGSVVVVDHIRGVVDGTVLRLCEMGLVPGTTVTITRKAPLGDPIEVSVRGTRLCMRQKDARRFGVVDESAAVAVDENVDENVNRARAEPR